MKSEMMKAFASCVFHEDECEQCPYFKYEDCTEKLTQDLDNLINHLQAENATLRSVVKQNHLIRDNNKSPLSLLTAEIKAEAYKECIEKIHSLIHPEYDKIHKQLDNLLKELIGEDNYET